MVRVVSWDLRSRRIREHSTSLFLRLFNQVDPDPRRRPPRAPPMSTALSAAGTLSPRHLAICDISNPHNLLHLLTYSHTPGHQPCRSRAPFCFFTSLHSILLQRQRQHTSGGYGGTCIAILYILGPSSTLERLQATSVDERSRRDRQ